MTTFATRPVSSLRVPVSTTETSLAKRETLPLTTTNLPKQEMGVSALVGANPAHKNRLVGVLVHTYGWVLGQDGNLYAPDSSLAWGERVN